MVIFKQLVVKGFLEEPLILIVPSSFVLYLLMPLRRLMDVSFMLFKMNKDTCSFQKLKLVH